MTDDDVTLSDFGLGATMKPPLVERRRIIQSPHTGKIAGFIGHEKRRDFTAYTALRMGAHYYYNEQGYAISDSILDVLRDRVVSRVLIHEGTEDEDADVYEFTLRQYVDHGDPVHEDDLHDPSDPQTFVELDEYVHKWGAHSRHLFVRPFGRACDRIGWRGYDPELKEKLQGGNQ